MLWFWGNVLVYLLCMGVVRYWMMAGKPPWYLTNHRVSVFLRCCISKVTERRVHASWQRRCPFSVVRTVCRWCLDCAAGPEESSQSEIQRLQKFYHRNCRVFMAPRKSADHRERRVLSDMRQQSSAKQRGACRTATGRGQLTVQLQSLHR